MKQAFLEEGVEAE